MTLSNITAKLTSMKSSAFRIAAAATLAGAALIAATPAAHAQRIVVGIGGPAYYAPAPPVVYGYGYPGYYGPRYYGYGYGWRGYGWDHFHGGYYGRGYYGHGGWYGHGGYGRGYRR